MAATTLFTCLCGVQKKTTNHWVLARVNQGHITFSPWDDKLAMEPETVVLCGEGCAAAMLSRSLSDWKQSTALRPGPVSVHHHAESLVA